jgi:hypothetical protein
MEHRPLPSPEALVVRGVSRRGMEPAGLARRARLDYPSLGFYGISVFSEDSLSVGELVQAGEVPHPYVQCSTVARLHDAGFDVLPTFRAPHCSVKLSDETPDDQLEEVCRVLCAAFDPPEERP